MSSELILEVNDVSKSFRLADGQELPVLHDISFASESGRFIAFIGPSGSGKSTLLTVLAGLEQPDRGDVRLDGAEHDSLLGRSAYMPQRDALMPWRTVLDNTAVGLEIAGVSREVARQRARELLKRFGLERFASSYPDQLSGGMRSRVALLRTTATRRPLLLLDEPFGALDSITREEVQAWLLDVLESERSTALLVTHDIEEAVYLADEVYVLSRRPATITHRISVDLPRPRPRGVLRSAEFSALTRNVRTALDAVMRSGESPGGEGER